MENPKICVFCSSNDNLNKDIQNQAIQLAHILLKNNFTLVTGGADMGVMKILGYEYFKNQKKTIAVIPQIFYTKQLLCPYYTNTIVTTDLSERKKVLIDISDAFIIFPGGIGTMDEFFELLVAKTLYNINKKIILLNLNGFYDNLIIFFQNLIQQKLIADNLFNIANNLNEIEKHLNQIHQ